MTRTLLLVSAAVGAVVFSAGTAAAQSGPFDWTGFYAGVHGGFITGNVKIDENPSMTTGTLSGVVGGVLAGYNFMQSPISPNILGIEADIGWSNAAGNGGGSFCVDSSFDYLYDLRSIGHVRVTAGAPMGAWEPFIAAGLAFADLNISDCGRLTEGGNFFGGTLGVGVNMKLSQRVSARGEFLYDIFQSKQYDDFKASFTAWTARAAIIVRLP